MSIFGQTLQATMLAYEDSHPTDLIPYVIKFLTEGILALKGHETEGIFRVSGDGDTVSELKARLERGQYQLVRPSLRVSIQVGANRCSDCGRQE